MNVAFWHFSEVTTYLHEAFAKAGCMVSLKP
jgi:hypothetical protein